MPDKTDSAAVACLLSGAEHEERLAWIRRINASGLYAVARHGSRIELAYDRSAAAAVHELIRREQRCCPFLQFAVHDGDTTVRLAIDAPEGASELADALFGAYRAMKGPAS